MGLFIKDMDDIMFFAYCFACFANLFAMLFRSFLRDPTFAYLTLILVHPKLR